MILTKRTKIILGLVGAVVLITAGVFVWGVKTGKIKFRAETLPAMTTTSTTLDFVLERPKLEFWEIPATNSSEIAEEVTPKDTRSALLKPPQVSAQQTANIRVLLLDSITDRGVANAQVDVWTGGYEKQTTTDSNGFFLLNNFPLESVVTITVEKEGYIMFWQDFLITEKTARLNQNFPIKIRLRPFIGLPESDRVHFSVYGKEAVEAMANRLINPNMRKNIKRLATILKLFEHGDVRKPKGVRVVDVKGLGAPAGVYLSKGGVFFHWRYVETSDPKLVSSPLERKLGLELLKEKYLAYKPHWRKIWQTYKDLEREQTGLQLPSCSDGSSHFWGLFYEHCYNAKDDGKPRDNYEELFASFYSIRQNYLSGFHRNIGELSSNPRENYLRNIGIYAYELLSTMLGEEWNHPYLGRPVNLNKIPNQSDILNGRY